MKKKAKKTKYNLLMYVANSSPKIKRFDDIKDLNSFVAKFDLKYPDATAGETGYWIDYAVTGITGELISNKALSFRVT
jgi:hypothetical protein